MYKRFFYFATALLFLSTLPACGIFAPFIMAWKNVGASEDDRKVLLAPQVKKFGEALYWGKGEAVLFVDPAASPELKKSLAIQRDDLRVVETKLRSAEFEDGARTAKVEFMVKYYRIPFYIVTESVEKQLWKFEVGGTWRILKRELAEEFKR